MMRHNTHNTLVLTCIDLPVIFHSGVEASDEILVDCKRTHIIQDL